MNNEIVSLAETPVIALRSMWKVYVSLCAFGLLNYSVFVLFGVYYSNNVGFYVIIRPFVVMGLSVVGMG